MSDDRPDWTKTMSVFIDAETPPAYIVGKTESYEDTGFVTGESPKVLDVNNDLGRNAHDGYIVNDGDGDIIYEISSDGDSYGGEHTLKKDEWINFFMLDIDRIRLTWVANSAYRVMVV